MDNSDENSVRPSADWVDDSRLFHALLRHIPDRVYFKDRESRFIDCSDSLAAKFQCSKVSEVIGKQDFDFFSEEHAQKAFDDEQRVMKTGQSLTNVVEKELLQDGSVTWALSTKSPLVNSDGETIGILGISKDITALKEAEANLQETHEQLLETSRLAGRAEVATGVLHNVGNVLNSLNVSSTVVANLVRKNRFSKLEQLADLLIENEEELPKFFDVDKRAQQIPGYLKELADHFTQEREELLSELGSLKKNIEHIRKTINMQQNYAQIHTIEQTVSIQSIIKDALQINEAGLNRHEVEVYCEYEVLPSVILDGHKLLQILVNLISNAKYAMDTIQSGRKILRIRTSLSDESILISIQDNGIGIPEVIMPQIFEHGFTTRKEGHGFGLHSSALAAQELGGELSVHSEGKSLGAEFILRLPCKVGEAESNE